GLGTLTRFVLDLGNGLDLVTDEGQPLRDLPGHEQGDEKQGQKGDAGPDGLGQGYPVAAVGDAVQEGTRQGEGKVDAQLAGDDPAHDPDPFAGVAPQVLVDQTGEDQRAEDQPEQDERVAHDQHD